jgi:hypothetical protein
MSSANDGDSDSERVATFNENPLQPCVVKVVSEVALAGVGFKGVRSVTLTYWLSLEASGRTRPPGVDVAGVWCSVISRGEGNDRNSRDDTDPLPFLGWFSELAGRFSVEAQ